MKIFYIIFIRITISLNVIIFQIEHIKWAKENEKWEILFKIVTVDVDKKNLT